MIRSRLSTVLSSEVCTAKSVFELLISDNIVEEILLCKNLQSRRSSQEWKHVSKEEFMAFIGVLLLARAEIDWDVDIRQLFSDPLKNLAYKAAFGTSRFENIRCHIRFDDKQTRVARLEQDKLAAFSFVWELFIENCKTSYDLGGYTTVDEQLVRFRGRCSFTQYMPSKPGKKGI